MKMNTIRIYSSEQIVHHQLKSQMQEILNTFHIVLSKIYLIRG